MFKSTRHAVFLLGSVSLLCGCALFQKSGETTSYGKYIGTVEARWLDDGRRMELLKTLTFIDVNNLEWVAPAGSIVDGASIPQAAWSLVGGPFEGKYRNASVIHDVACVEKKRPWQSVHNVFYDAMRASGVDELKAKTMYAAVYQFGPRWDLGTTAARAPAQPLTPEQFERLKTEIAAREKSNPMTLEEIRNFK